MEKKGLNILGSKKSGSRAAFAIQIISKAGKAVT